MRVLEYKLVVSADQSQKIDEALRASQFIRNKALAHWYQDQSRQPFALNRYCAVLAQEYPFANALNSQARQAAAERAAYAIGRYLKADKIGKRLVKPKFQKDNRSVEYKITGWKLSNDRKRIKFKDHIGIGEMRMLGTRNLCDYDLALIKRVRILKKADGCYVQFCIEVDRTETLDPTGQTIGLDMGLAKFYTDSNGESVDCPKFLRKGEKKIKRAQRKHSCKVKGSNNSRKSKTVLGRRHLKVQRQRKDFAVKLARCVVRSNDLVALEDLQVRNMIKNHCLAKSIADVSWGIFSHWLSYYGSVFGRPVIKVPPAYTSQDCSSCGRRVQKSLSERTHACQCGCVLDRDHNAAKNILRLGLALDSKPYEEELSPYPGAQGNGLDMKSFDVKGTLVESGPLPTANAGM
jgi:putative transposase